MRAEREKNTERGKLYRRQKGKVLSEVKRVVNDAAARGAASSPFCLLFAIYPLYLCGKKLTIHW
jgi:hypothetical protein